MAAVHQHTSFLSVISMDTLSINVKCHCRSSYGAALCFPVSWERCFFYSPCKFSPPPFLYLYFHAACCAVIWCFLLLGAHLEFCDLEWGVEKEPSLKWVYERLLRMWFFGVINFEGWVSGAFLLSSHPFLSLLIPLPSVQCFMCSVSGGRVLHTELLLGMEASRREAASINHSLDFIRVFM